MAKHRRIRVSLIGDVAKASLSDKRLVDSQSIEELGHELSALIEADNIQNVLLNFEGVEFLSSAALNLLVALDQKMKRAGGRLQLCGVRPEILEVFAITRLDRIFDIRRNGDEPDDGPEMSGASVPNPDPPDELDGHAKPPPSQ